MRTLSKIGMGLGVLVLFFACGSAKRAPLFENFDHFSEVIHNKIFTIENEWALPMGGHTVQLIGNPNYIRLKGDNAEIFLPYFGVRHSGGALYRSGEGSIRMNGRINNLTITEERDRNTIVLKFDGNHNTENFEFVITMFPNGSTNTSVTSSQRVSISYQGDVRHIPEELKIKE